MSDRKNTADALRLLLEWYSFDMSVLINALDYFDSPARQLQTLYVHGAAVSNACPTPETINWHAVEQALRVLIGDETNA